MEKEVNIIDPTKQEVIFKIAKAEFEPLYFEAYKKIQPNVDMPGFRKGKVPINIIKKRFGQEIEADVHQEYINDSFKSYVQEGKVPVVGNPALVEIDEKDGAIEAKIEYEVMPEFQLSEFKGIVVDEPVHAVTDEEVMQEIDNILSANGKVEPAEQIEDLNHIATVKFTEIDKESKLPVTDNKPYETNVYLADQHVTPLLRQSLLNLKPGDTTTFNPQEGDPQAPDKLFEVTVMNVEKLIPQELTGEWVAKYTNEKFNSPDDFKEEISFKLQEKWDAKSKKELENNLVAKLIEDNNFPVPQGITSEVVMSMVSDLKERYKNSPYETNVSYEAMKDDLWPVAERNVRWEMIRNKIAEVEDIKVEDHDIEELIETQANQYNIDKSIVRKAFMENQQFIQSLLAQKVMDYVLDFAVTNEIEFASEHSHDDHDHGHVHLDRSDIHAMGYGAVADDDDDDDDFDDDDDEFGDLDEAYDDDFDEDDDIDEFDEDLDETIDPDELYDDEEDEDEDEDEKK